MPAGKLPYDVSWRGPLANCSGEQRVLAVALIDQFIHAFSQDDTLTWSPQNSRARRGVVRHPRDTNLRIDLQSSFADRRRPGRRWVSFYLEDGTISKSYAHLELECGVVYTSDDVRLAWLASLSNGLSATMVWLPGSFARRVLGVLSDTAFCGLGDILSAVTATNSIGEQEAQAFAGQVEQTLACLGEAGFVEIEKGQDMPDAGHRYMRTPRGTEWLGVAQGADEDESGQPHRSEAEFPG
jgi:hypothetical protein